MSTGNPLLTSGRNGNWIWRLTTKTRVGSQRTGSVRIAPCPRYITASIPDFYAAEDVSQTVAIKAFERREQFDSNASAFSTWVIGIARNEIMHGYRTAGRDRHVFSDEVLKTLTDVAAKVDAEEMREIHRALSDCLKHIADRGRRHPRHR